MHSSSRCKARLQSGCELWTAMTRRPRMYSWKSKTPALEFLRRRFHVYSTGSIASKARAGATSKAPESGWRSCRSWSSSTVGPSRRAARSAQDRHLLCGFRWAAVIYLRSGCGLPARRRLRGAARMPTCRKPSAGCPKGPVAASFPWCGRRIRQQRATGVLPLHTGRGSSSRTTTPTCWNMCWD